jgi:heme/copper-type cytochrome/quinol oxidase subunit 4
MQRPGLSNSVIGFITTFVNVYTAQDKTWSTTAVVTIVIITACVITFSILYILCRYLRKRVIDGTLEYRTMA